MSELWRGDCVEVMARMEAASVDAICTDPPYGLEFMGKEWDKFSVAGMSNPESLGGRQIEWPRHTATRRHRTPNRTCATCGGRETGAKRCECPEPEWKPIGARRSSDAPEGMTGGGMTRQMHAFQEWCETWAREALRVLKPGGYLLAFGGTRTYHRLACAVEDAGFEIRDRILVEGEEVGHPVELAWLYGSGFPKSLDVARAIDKAARGVPQGTAEAAPDDRELVSEAEEWTGWGTALKPSHEPIVVARKPLAERNIAANVLAHGTGALNVDGGRIEGPDENPSIARRQGSTTHLSDRPARESEAEGRLESRQSPERYAEARKGEELGRWPANVVLVHGEGCERVGTRRVRSAASYERVGDVENRIYGEGAGRKGTGDNPRPYADADGTERVEAWECAAGCPVAALDKQTGELAAGNHPARRSSRPDEKVYGTGWSSGTEGERRPTEAGGASRFFYCAKSPRGEREAGLLGKVTCAACGGLDTLDHPAPTDENPERRGACIRNDHPTVKPIEVMRWLLRIVTPPGGRVLDPFAGSGTTLCAGELEGVHVVGIEQDERSSTIAAARAAHWSGVAEWERREAEQRGVQLALV